MSGGGLHIGDWVMVKLWPRWQTSTKQQQDSYGKLSKRFYGPFQVLDRVGPVAYRLKLPKGTSVHPVFHCSLLKPFKGSSETTDTTPLPDQIVHNQPLISPLAILDYCQASSGVDSHWEVLVQWSGLSPDETSWESWPQLCRDYHLVDKVHLQGPWNDRETGVQEATSSEPSRDINNGVQLENNAKRIIIKPSYLQDYMWRSCWVG